MATRARRWPAIVLPLLIVVGWIAIAGPLGSFAGRLGDVQSNDDSAFLPRSAESTQVARLRRGFEDGAAVPAVVLWEGTADAAAAGRSLDGLRDITVGPPAPARVAADRKAVQVVVPLRPGLADPAAAIRRIRSAAGAVPGATVYVAGPAALRADLGAAFTGIDGVLLLVAVGVVLLILLVVYRSLLLPVIVIVAALLALGTASAVVYALAKHGVLTLNGQTQGIMFILVVGATTDYSLLYAIRLREELAARPKAEAVRLAWRRSVAPIAASAFTVAAGLLTLLLSDLNSDRALGPVAAIGIACALAAALTFLPAALALAGRAAYWPARARPAGGVWNRVAALVGAHPRRIWAGATLVLCALAAFVPALRAGGIPQTDVFLTRQPSVVAQQAVARHFPAGAGSPAVVLTRDAGRALPAVRSTPGVAEAAVLPKSAGGLHEIDAVLAAPPDSDAALATVGRLRAVPGVLVGGYSATQYDTRRTAERDRRVIVPVALAVILVILALLLGAVAAPVLLIITVALSFAATLGVSALVFDHLFHFPGADPSVPLFGFVFLVALGVDYNIFLATRIKEETAAYGTREATLRGLVATGGVITSAGVVLAATFGALAVIPLVFLAEIAFIVAFGVLLDTLVVRSLLVPALFHDIGDATWWPRRVRPRGGALPDVAADEAGQRQ